MLRTETEEGIIGLVEELASLMQFKLSASLYASEGQIEINVTGPDRPYLITDKGETLLSMQYILARMIHQRFPETEELHILLDSDGYMYRHEEELRRMAHRAMQRARRERRKILLPPLNPYDRRIIHMEIADSRDLDSVSEGDGFLKKIAVHRRR